MHKVIKNQFRNGIPGLIWKNPTITKARIDKLGVKPWNSISQEIAGYKDFINWVPKATR